eukprot:gene9257-biopygen15075
MLGGSGGLPTTTATEHLTSTSRVGVGAHQPWHAPNVRPPLCMSDILLKVSLPNLIHCSKQSVSKMQEWTRCFLGVRGHGAKKRHIHEALEHRLAVLQYKTALHYRVHSRDVRRNLCTPLLGASL